MSIFLSTESNPFGDNTVKCKQRDGTIIQVPSVPVVKNYNKNMGGVALHDQLRGYYAVVTKSRKCWRYLFWFCVDVSIVNSFLLEQKAVNHQSRTQLEFRVELAKDLMGNLSSGRLGGGHRPITFSKGQSLLQWAASAAASVFVWIVFQPQ